MQPFACWHQTVIALCGFTAEQLDRCESLMTSFCARLTITSLRYAYCTQWKLEMLCVFRISFFEKLIEKQTVQPKKGSKCIRQNGVDFQFRSLPVKLQHFIYLFAVWFIRQNLYRVNFLKKTMKQRKKIACKMNTLSSINRGVVAGAAPPHALLSCSFIVNTLTAV